ncbi:MAG TPA: histidine--tRNA ligase [Candidatus Nitrosopolaris sp.]|nr:histidine--tRNA ligase [Candidatus Nitrosopolaris sp.]
MKFELPRGMRDLESEELTRISSIREKFFDTMRLFNFKGVEPSPIELLSTLEAKAGASISNEIYSFTDKGDRDIALRFDLTVGLTRLVASRRDLKMPVKIGAFAGVWRYDEPQAARYRYFHQWDVEIYDSFSVESDAEVIEFVSSFLKKLGLKATIEVNDLKLIVEYIQSVLGVHDQQVIREMLRAIDKVQKKGQSAVLDEYSSRIDSGLLRNLLNFVSTKGTLENVRSILGARELAGWGGLEDLIDSLKSRKLDAARINLGIVRGLDYYSGIVFEAFDPVADVGALVGGGRYDTLTEGFGRKDIGATGAAGGVERIMIAMQTHGLLHSLRAPVVYVAYESPIVRSKALEIVSDLRNSGISTDYDTQRRSLRKQLEDAIAKSSALTVIIKEKDAENGVVTLQDMRERVETKLSVKDLKQVAYKFVQQNI